MKTIIVCVSFLLITSMLSATETSQLDAQPAQENSAAQEPKKNVASEALEKASALFSRFKEALAPITAQALLAAYNVYNVTKDSAVVAVDKASYGAGYAFNVTKDIAAAAGSKIAAGTSSSITCVKEFANGAHEQTHNQNTTCAAAGDATATFLKDVATAAGSKIAAGASSSVTCVKEFANGAHEQTHNQNTTCAAVGDATATFLEEHKESIITAIAAFLGGYFIGKVANAPTPAAPENAAHRLIGHKN